MEGCTGNAEEAVPPSVSGPFGSSGLACRGALGIVFFSLKKKTIPMKMQLFKMSSLGFSLLKSLQ